MKAKTSEVIRRFLAKPIAPWGLLVFVLLLVGMSPNTWWLAYHEKLWPALVLPFKTIFQFGHYAFGQWIFYGLLALLLVQLFRLLLAVKQKKRSRVIVLFKRLGYGLLAIMLLYQATWGLRYKAPSLAEKWQIDSTVVSDSLLALQVQWHFNHVRALQLDSHFRFSSQPETYQTALHQAYTELSSETNALHFQEPAFVKKVFWPQLMSLFGISGIYFPFTGEANINQHIPANRLPFVMAHEMAHQQGVAAEDEAHFMAMLVCLQSPDTALQLSAHYTAARYCLGALHDTLWASQLWDKAPTVLQQMSQENARYWEKYRGWLSSLSHRINDVFLRWNGDARGIASYADLPRWLVGYFQHHSPTAAKRSATIHGD